MGDSILLGDPLPAGKRNFTDALKNRPLDDMQNEIEKKPKRQRGGNNERNALLRAQLASFEQLLKGQRRLEEKVDKILEAKK